MTKAEARKEFIQKRQALSEGEFQNLNLQLYNHFFAQVDLSFIKCLHVFFHSSGFRTPV
jgi:hypothetical protein